MTKTTEKWIKQKVKESFVFFEKVWDRDWFENSEAKRNAEIFIKTLISTTTENTREEIKQEIENFIETYQLARVGKSKLASEIKKEITDEILQAIKNLK